MEGAFQHVLTDLFAFIATAVAGAVILLTGFTRADGIAALLVAALMLRSGVGLLRDSGRVLLEAAPRGIDPSEIGRALASRRTWWRCTTCTSGRSRSGFPALSAHVVVRTGCDTQSHRRQLALLLRRALRDRPQHAPGGGAPRRPAGDRAAHRAPPGSGLPCTRPKGPPR